MPEQPPIRIDPEQAAEAIRQLAAALVREAEDDGPPMFLAERHGKRLCALLFKRTYAVENGRCVPVSDDEQSPFCFEDVPYDPDLPPPFVSPLIAAEEQYAFKPATDLVIQADAHAHQPGATRLTASVRFGKHLREIVVHGDRRGDFDTLGRPRFTDPEPIESVPVRWDHAYGGFDHVACKQSGYMKLIAPLMRAQPEMEFATDTPFHYPRNPAGCGYMIELDRARFEGLRIPNLEHPDEPLWPQRLAIGSPDYWLRGPLPAAWDFQDPGWFPRCGYAGVVPPYEDGVTVAEIKRGWAAKDLLSIPPLTHLRSPADVRLEISQAAAPGMCFTDIAPDQRFELRNLHPSKPVHTIDLPGEAPRVAVELTPGSLTEIETRLNTVVLRVTLKEVELLWSARFEVPAGMDEDVLPDLRRRVEWVRRG